MRNDDCVRVRGTEPTNMLDMKAVIWLETYLQVAYQLL